MQETKISSKSLILIENIGFSRYFGMYLLSGEVFPSLSKHVPHLLSTPGSLIKSYSKIIPRVSSLITALVNRQITSKSKLIGVWKEDPNCKSCLIFEPLRHPFLKLIFLSDLLTEYQQWLPSKFSGEIATDWPPSE